MPPSLLPASPARPAALLALLLLAGCPPSTVTYEEFDGYQEEVDGRLDAVEAGGVGDAPSNAELADQLAALQADHATLAATVAQQTSDIAALQADMVALQEDVRELSEGGVTREELDEAIAGLATVDSVDTLAGRVDGHDTDIDALRTGVDGLTTAVADLGATCATDAELTDAIAGLGGIYATTIDVEALQDNDATQDTRLDALEADALTVVHRIETDTTYDVPADGTLDEILAELDGYLLDADATVTIRLADGTYSFDHELEIRHPDGASIHIVGDEADPDDVVLSFDADTDGIVVREGHALGYLAGVTVTGTGGEGIVASYGSYLGLGPVAVSGFGYGIHASIGSIIAPTPVFEAVNTASSGWVDTSGNTYGITADYGSVFFGDNVVSNDNGYRGIAARYGSTVRAQGATVSGSDNDGVQSSYGSYLDVAGAQVAGSGGDGVSASYGSVITAGGSRIDGNGASGLVASWGSVVDGYAVSSEDNGGYGFTIQYNSTFYMYNISDAGNGNGPYPTDSVVIGSGGTETYSSSYMFN